VSELINSSVNPPLRISLSRSSLKWRNGSTAMEAGSPDGRASAVTERVRYARETAIKAHAGSATAGRQTEPMRGFRSFLSGGVRAAGVRTAMGASAGSDSSLSAGPISGESIFGEAGTRSRKAGA